MTDRDRDRRDEGRPTLTYNQTLVLQALSRECEYGFEIMELTGLSSGTVYPSLRRLEAGGLLASDREDPERAHARGRPARRYYRITPEGREALQEAVERLRARQRLLGLEETGPA